jgi:hypothetical protein
MGAAFFSPGTIRIRDVLQDAFGPANVAGNATNYGSLFNPAGPHTLDQIVDSPNMDLPPRNDKNWPTLHGRFRDFLKALNNADPTTHVAIKTAMYSALTANPPMPMNFHVAHQNAGYQFVSWTEDDDAGLTWLNCLLFCPTMPAPVAKRLLHVVAHRQAGKGRRSPKVRGKK